MYEPEPPDADAVVPAVTLMVEDEFPVCEPFGTFSDNGGGGTLSRVRVTVTVLVVSTWVVTVSVTVQANTAEIVPTDIDAENVVAAEVDELALIDVEPLTRAHA